MLIQKSATKPKVSSFPYEKNWFNPKSHGPITIDVHFKGWRRHILVPDHQDHDQGEAAQRHEGRVSGILAMARAVAATVPCFRQPVCVSMFYFAPVLGNTWEYHHFLRMYIIYEIL